MSSSDPASTPDRDPPPSPATTEDATLLMVAAANGDKAAADRLLPLVYAQLRSAAQRGLEEERAGHTLSATAIVHEAYIKLSGPRQVPWEGRGHFYAAAAEAMRQVLLDHAKGRLRLKRGGGGPGREAAQRRSATDFADVASLSDLITLEERAAGRGRHERLLQRSCACGRRRTQEQHPSHRHQRESDPHDPPPAPATHPRHRRSF